ncbi:MAG: molybdopterin-dependent oxidoreductase, partial [Actinomycetota bacterium]|nr:molybdopterin-dependent oxidoreductase [Actinomycetota bacterium]
MTSPTIVTRRVRGGVGESVVRSDGVPKVKGAFAFSSDLQAKDMLWGATLRSPHASAKLLRLDTGPASALPGVRAVLTIDDVPGRRTFGLEVPDQPVLADGEVRYWGEPVAIVAAEDPEEARRGALAIDAEYRELSPQVDPQEAERSGVVMRHLRIRRGDQHLRGEVAVEGYYEVGMQDQAPLGTESGLAIPDGEGGVDLYVSTQWLHVDHQQVVASLGLRPEQVRVHQAGIGGAFGAREDVSLQIHLCLLALRTGRPVKMVYGREESFVGHVHRHPARMWYRHEADRRGLLVRVEARVLLDGGAYTSTSPAVIANASYFSIGPYRCPSVAVDGRVVRTNNPPCGAMRGFGAVQACFGHESQMDRLAAALDMDPVELRLRNSLDRGDMLPTSGQEIEGPLPVAETLRSVAAIPLPEPASATDPRQLPGGTGLTTPPSAVKRGIGYAVGFKNVAYSEGFDDYAEARVVLTPMGAEVHTAATEVGQGLVTIIQQIARTALGMEQVAVVFQDTSGIGSAGSTSASRQSQMAGGAVLAAAQGVRQKALARAGGDELTDQGVLREGTLVVTLDELCADGPLEHLERFRHPPTEEPDADGQGRIHAGFAVSAHRAVVDVDRELGLVRVVQVDTAQDVGKALNPSAVRGQIEGGIMQGVGLAVMEELVLEEGRILNASFTDYLLPT